MIKALPITALLVLAGCASHPEYHYDPEDDPGRGLVPEVEQDDETRLPKQNEQSAQESTTQYSYVEPQPQVRAPRNSGVASLVAKADLQLQQRNYEEAGVLLERALRIEPKDADLYYRLAIVRLQQGEFFQAEELAKRGLSMAHDQAQRSSLQKLIVRSQKARG